MTTTMNPFTDLETAIELGPSTGIERLDYWDRPGRWGWRTVIMSPDGLAHALADQIGGPDVLRLDPRNHLSTLLGAIDHRADETGSRPRVAVVDLDVCWPGSRESWDDVVRLLVSCAKLREIHLVCPYTTHPDARHLDSDALLSIGSTVWRISRPSYYDRDIVVLRKGKDEPFGSEVALEYDATSRKFSELRPMELS